MSFEAFNAVGPTVKITAATSPPSGVQAIGAPPANQYRLHNAGSSTIFIAFGADASTAQSNAVIPTGSGANSKNSQPLSAGAIEVFTAPLNCYWSGIVASGTADFYVTPGRGL